MSLKLLPGASGGHDNWPPKLRTQQGLRLERGEVLNIDHRLYAIVGYDGRNEGYMCWPCDNEGHYDVQCLVIIPRTKAHGAQKELDARCLVPGLPQLDHTGRIFGQAPPLKRMLSGNLQSVPADQMVTFVCAQDTMSPTTSSFMGTRTPPCQTPPYSRSCPSTPPSQARNICPVSSWGGGVPGLGLLPAPPWGGPSEPPVDECDSWRSRRSTRETSPHDAAMAPVKRCAVCVMLRTMAFTLSQALGRASGSLRRVSQIVLTPRGAGPPKVSVTTIDNFTAAGTSSRQSEQLSQYYPRAAAQPSRGRSDALRDMKITIPIVKPPNWKELAALIDQRAVTFDERGIKETMTVRSHRWSSFVDRQKEKIQSEIREARRALGLPPREVALAGGSGLQVLSEADAVNWDPTPTKPAASAAKTGATAQGLPCFGQPAKSEGDESSGDGSSQDDTSVSSKPEVKARDKASDYSEDDVCELELLVERMEDWKDLARYSGESITMASTQCGNEMKIHVLAFAEREDGAGVDYMRLSYKKSVEVRDKCPIITRAHPVSLALGYTLRAMLPSLRASSPGSSAEDQEADREQWIQLLQRPDVAKFTIALAFRRALENDGIQLRFCEARLDDADKA